MGVYIYKIKDSVDTNLGTVGLFKFWYKPSASIFSDYTPKRADYTIECLQDKYAGGVDIITYEGSRREAVNKPVYRIRSKSVAIHDDRSEENIGILRKRGRGQYYIEPSK